MRSSVLNGLLVGLLSRYATAQTPATTDFDWGIVKPSTSLDYTSCYDDFRCAKLSVPLDWLNNSTTANGTSRVTIAIITLPATVDETDPSFGGTIIVNPGGPGGSGVDFLLEVGKYLQGMADDTKHYEFLSFDPRGVSRTEPSSDCYNNEFARDLAAFEMRAVGPLDSGLEVVRRQTALWGAFGRLCEDGAEIHAYMSTASVARDMVEIVDKLDEARGRNGTAKVSSRGGARLLGQRQGADVPRIQYWGLSYGTVIGNYFASMFPGRVGRIILEGVVDANDYTRGAWSTNLQDTDKDYATFWSTCFDAGSKCALYQSNDTSADDIRTRFDAWLDELNESPAPYISGSNIEAITRTDVINYVFGGLYEPLQYFPSGAAILAGAMQGNLSTLYASIGVPQAASFCPSTAPTSYTWTNDALAAIGCGDATSQANLTTPEYMDYVGLLKSQSPDFAAYWARIRLGCKGWRVRPAYRFEGPFTTPPADARIVDGKPAAPLLFLSSQYDPVTPHANAVAMAAGHPGARVLTQNNAGHGTMLVPGTCRDGYVKKYFETGELPPEGTVCQPDCVPFQDCPQAPLVTRGLKGGIPRSARRGKAPLSIW
ncbi:alpha/beta-hydrolase [Jackrogersella minutella]|nr:alpha/beta-hydrolase [Jackrogersella minutella]